MSISAAADTPACDRHERDRLHRGLIRASMTGVNRLKIVAVIIAALLCSIAYLVSSQLRSPGFDYQRVESLLNTIKQLDVEWSVDIQRLELGALNGNYDTVVAPLQPLHRYYLELKQMTADERVGPKRDNTIATLLQSYKTTMDRKVGLVDEIKSQYAILSNSSRFLPVASDDLLNAVDNSGLNTFGQVRIKDLLNSILSKTMSYTLLHDTRLGQCIGQQTQALRQLAGQAPQAVATATEPFVEHVGLILRERETGNKLLVALAALPTERAIDDLRNRILQDREETLARQKIYLAALVPFSGLLLAAVAGMAWRLYRYYRQLSHANSMLKMDNDETQSQLIHSAKMAALGQMVAGVAHEINTPLAYVKATFSQLSETLRSIQEVAKDPVDFAKAIGEAGDPDGDEPSLLDDINILLDDGIHGVDQISALVLAMKKFSRLDQEKFGEFSIPELLDNALLISRYKLKHVVDIEKDYQTIPDIRCSPSQLSQVFLNIVTNAAQAIGERPVKGKIAVRTVCEGLDMVRVDISDDGCGIADDVLPHIFDPFFTTKSVGEGTGLGLSICYRIVRSHGGQILVASKLGEGTTFSVILPVASTAASDGYEVGKKRVRI